jgi:hypothetical protein
LSACIWIVGCETPVKPSPVAGWKSLGWDSPNKVISDDYRNFIKTMPSGESYYVQDYNIKFSEDGTGQHAVTIGIPLDGNWWSYVLIYDKSNARTKVFKFVSGRYRS